MPNRMIKDTIRTSRSVNNLTDFQFRVWLYLITYVDDYGRGSADPELLKGLVFPRRKGITEQQLADALAHLANTGMIIFYEVDGESYFYFPKWADHQRIQTKKSKYPDPPKSTVSHRESPPEIKPNQARNRNQTETKIKPISPCANARTREDDPELARVMNFYLNQINPAPSSSCIELLKQYTKTLGGDVTVHALEIANDEGKRSWSYIQAILQRCESTGIRSLEDFRRTEDERRKSRDAAAPGKRMSKSEAFAAAGRDHHRTAAEMDKLLNDLDRI